MSFYVPRRRTAAPKEVPVRQLLVGSSLNATCRKCKGKTEHLVVAKVGVKPSRVECTVCKDIHDYAVPAPRRSAERLAADPSWADAMLAATGEAAPYSAGGSYRVGARVNHASFGEGIVMRHSSSTVCEVLFESRTIKLLMAPVPRGFEPPAPSASRASVGRRRRFG
ncbi:MAG: hypothetical protein AB1689_24980 [Thermodesulfobacteriota bacterium]